MADLICENHTFVLRDQKQKKLEISRIVISIFEKNNKSQNNKDFVLMADLNQFIANQRTRFVKENQHPPLSLDQEIELVKKTIASIDPNSSDGQSFALEQKLSKNCLEAFLKEGLAIITFSRTLSRS